MRFSEHFGIDRTNQDDWFDPHLTVDTRLFIDPLLLLEAGGDSSTAHDELINHFVECYRLVARGGDRTSNSAMAARRLLTFPKPYEIGLGYTASGTRGAGSGDRFASDMADGIARAIEAGLDSPEHIEEIGILNVGIGHDRISDAVANVLKGRLIAYTQEIAARHDLPFEEHKVKHTRINIDAARWVDEKVLLPTNPSTGRPVILVPEASLNELPTLDADDWFDSHFNADIRLQMNLQVGRSASKADIVSWARRHPDRVRALVREQSERDDLTGYDFSADRLGVVQWDREGDTYAASNPLTMRPITTHDDLTELIGDVIGRFRHFVEEQRGWKLLQNEDGSDKPEEAAQLLPLGVAQPYLRQFGVELDREVELGRGPVDFKASSGTNARVLIEAKNLHNGKFWNGLEHQLQSYLTSDESTHGWLLAIQYRSTKTYIDRVGRLPAVVASIAATFKRDIRFAVVDARRPLSVSNIEGDARTDETSAPVHEDG